MKKVSILFILCAICTTICAQSTVLDRFIQHLNTHPLQSSIVLTISEKGAQPMTYSGKMTMLGEKFLLSIMDTEAAFDGSSLYMYSADTKELNITTPSREELTESNPLLYAQALVKVCSLSEKSNPQTGETTITLTPKDQSIGIQSFVLRLKTATLLPVSIDVREGTGYTKLSLQSPQYITNAPKFTLTKPGAFINDLR